MYAGEPDVFRRQREDRDPNQPINRNCTCLVSADEERGPYQKSVILSLQTWGSGARRRGGANGLRSQRDGCDKFRCRCPPFLLLPMVITELVLPWLLHDRSWGLYDKNPNKHLRWERTDGWFKQVGLVVLQKGFYIRDTEIFLCDSAFFLHYFSGNSDTCNQHLIILLICFVEVLADPSTLIRCEALFNRTEAKMLGFGPEVRDVQEKEGDEPRPTVVFLIHLSWGDY